MVKYQEGRGLEKDTVVTEGSHVSIQVGAIRIMRNEEGMVHMEKERMGCVGRRWEGGG